MDDQLLHLLGPYFNLGVFELIHADGIIMEINPLCACLPVVREPQLASARGHAKGGISSAFSRAVIMRKLSHHDSLDFGDKGAKAFETIAADVSLRLPSVSLDCPNDDAIKHFNMIAWLSMSGKYLA
eukprot:scaffold34847_cov20-Prasinocladus_malaysianus.AAC.1